MGSIVDIISCSVTVRPLFNNMMCGSWRFKSLDSSLWVRKPTELMFASRLSWPSAERPSQWLRASCLASGSLRWLVCSIEDHIFSTRLHGADGDKADQGYSRAFPLLLGLHALSCGLLLVPEPGLVRGPAGVVPDFDENARGRQRWSAECSACFPSQPFFFLRIRGEMLRRTVRLSNFASPLLGPCLYVRGLSSVLAPARVRAPAVKG